MGWSSAAAGRCPTSRSDSTASSRKVGIATARAPAAYGGMDVIDLLKKDHEKVSALFARFQGGTGITGLFKRVTGSVSDRERQTALDGICQELEVHAALEEELLYPDVRARGDAQLVGMVDESLREHSRVKALVAALRNRDAANEDVDAKVVELKECVEHHVREEEHDLLPRYAQLASPDERARLGREMQARKRALAAGTRPAAAGARAKVATRAKTATRAKAGTRAKMGAKAGGRAKGARQRATASTGRTVRRRTAGRKTTTRKTSAKKRRARR